MGLFKNSENKVNSSYGKRVTVLSCATFEEAINGNRLSNGAGDVLTTCHRGSSLLTELLQLSMKYDSIGVDKTLCCVELGAGIRVDKRVH